MRRRFTPFKTPARKGLTLIDEDSPNACEEKRKKLCRIVILLTFASHKGRRDIQCTKNFLSRVVDVCSEQDYDKLRRLIQHVVDLLDAIFSLGTANLGVLTHFIASACGSYDDFKRKTILLLRLNMVLFILWQVVKS